MEFRTRRRRHRITEVNLTPLIDIVFQLLIFFLITTTFVQNPGIEVDLPKASASPTEQESETVVVAVTREGRIVHEGRAVSKEELREKLEHHHRQRASATVIVQADTGTEHGKVVEIMDLARQVGFSQLAIATAAQ